MKRETVIGGLCIVIDLDLCVGFGDCVEAAPDLFELDEADLADFLAPGVIDCDRVLAACNDCPVDAITVLDADGRTLAP